MRDPSCQGQVCFLLHLCPGLCLCTISFTSACSVFPSVKLQQGVQEIKAQKLKLINIIILRGLRPCALVRHKQTPQFQLRGSGLFLSSLSYLKDQKWALVSRHRLREFKRQLSSIMSKPSGISESAEIRCQSELMKSVPFPPPCTIYERPNCGVCT